MHAIMRGVLLVSHIYFSLLIGNYKRQGTLTEGKEFTVPKIVVICDLWSPFDYNTIDNIFFINNAKPTESHKYNEDIPGLLSTLWLTVQA